MVNTPPYRSSFAPVPTDECRYTRRCAPVPVYTTTSGGGRRLYDRTSHASQQFRAATGSTATDGSQTRAGSLSLLTTWARSDRKLGAPRLPQGHRPRPLRFCYSTASTVQESLHIQNSERRDRKVRSHCSLANAVSSKHTSASVRSTSRRHKGPTSTRETPPVFERSPTTLHSFTQLGDEAVRKRQFAVSDRFVPKLDKRMQNRPRASSNTTIPASRGQPLGQPTGTPNTRRNRPGRTNVSETAARGRFSTSRAQTASEL